MAKSKKKGFLPGMEPKTIKEIDRAAEGYVDIRDKRMALSEKEEEAQSLLTAAMKKHGLSTYQFDGRTVELVKAEKCKVRRNKEKDLEDNGEKNPEAKAVIEKTAEALKA